MPDLHKGHRERMRLRVEGEGLSGLRPHEILEYLLYYADARGDTNPAAHALIERFGSLEAVLHADAAELRRVPGVGARSAAWLGRIGALVDAYGELTERDQPAIGNLREMRAFAAANFAGVETEEVWQLCVSSSGRLLLGTRIADSALWGESATLRGALEEVLAVNAHSVLLLQLTGARPPEPEAYDIERTLAYAQTLTAIDVRLIDHVLMRGDRIVSLARSGLLAAARRPEPEARALMERYLAEE